MGKKKKGTEQYSALQDLLQGMKDLLFPPSCLLCGMSPGSPEGICDDCLQNVSLISSPLCPLCGCEMPDSAAGNHLCGTCLRKKPPFSSARGLVHYREPVTTLLHRLKYRGDTSVLPPLRKIVSLTAPVTVKGEDRIVPVPLHSGRMRQRGFNQAILLARLLFPYNKKSILVNTLQRIRQTKPQTGLDGAARRKNLKRAFKVCDSQRIMGRRIILVDDVFTTGTTVSECSRVLLASGAGEVDVLTLARVGN